MAPTEYEEKAVRKRWKKQDDPLQIMEDIQGALQRVDSWEAEPIRGALDALRKEVDSGFGRFVHPLRLALTGKSVGPGVFELAELLGKETCLERMAKATTYVTALQSN